MLVVEGRNTDNGRLLFLLEVGQKRNVKDERVVFGNRRCYMQFQV